MNKLKTIDNKTYIYTEKDGWLEEKSKKPAPEDVLKLLTTVEPSRAPAGSLPKAPVKRKGGRPKKTKEDYRAELDEAQVVLDKAQESLKVAQESLGDIEDDGTQSVEVRDTPEIRKARRDVKAALNNFSEIEDRYRDKLTSEEKAAYREENRKAPIEIAPIGRIPEKPLPGNRLPKRDSIHNSQAYERPDPKNMGAYADISVNRSYIPQYYMDGYDSVPEEIETKSSVEGMVDQLANIDGHLKTQLSQEEAEERIKNYDDRERNIEGDAIPIRGNQFGSNAISTSGTLAIAGLFATMFLPVEKALGALEATIDTFKNWYSWTFHLMPYDELERKRKIQQEIIDNPGKRDQIISRERDIVRERRDEVKGNTPGIINSIVDGAESIFDILLPGKLEESNPGMGYGDSDAESKPDENKKPTQHARPTRKSNIPSSSPNIDDHEDEEDEDPYAKWRNPPSGSLESVSKWLEDRGLIATFDRDRGSKSAHGHGMAVDINAPGGIYEAYHSKWGPIFDVLADELDMAGYHTLWRFGGKGKGNHNNHIHIQVGNIGMKGGGHTKIGNEGKHKVDNAHLRGKSGRSREQIRGAANDQAKEDIGDFIKSPSTSGAIDAAISSIKALASNLKGIAETDTYYKGSIEEITKRAEILNSSAVNMYVKKVESNVDDSEKVLQLPNLNREPGTIHTPGGSDDSWVTYQYIDYFKT